MSDKLKLFINKNLGKALGFAALAYILPFVIMAIGFKMQHLQFTHLTMYEITLGSLSLVWFACLIAMINSFAAYFFNIAKAAYVVIKTKVKGKADE